MLPDWELYTRWRAAFGTVLDERYHTLDWLDLQILSGEFRFWASENAALVTEIKTYPAGAKDVHVMVAAGDMGEIVEVLAPLAEAWGASQGCVAALVESRPAWARVLAPYGWEPHQLTLRKELRYGLV